MRIEIHLLQNFAPSNLNRDDTGSPKDAEFGTYRRARVSSQCQKRAVRLYFQRHALIPAERLSERTKRLVGEVASRLEATGKDRAVAERATTAAVTAAFPKSAEKNGEFLTPYLLFLGRDEIRRFSELVQKHWDVLAASPPRPVAAAPEGSAEADAPRRGRGGRGGRAGNKADDGPKLPQGLDKEIKALLDGGKAADLALFGRMLADLADKNVDAACQVAHAISTNRIHSMEMDYYTAVDDLKPDDNPGADMIGTVEFNSACYYRYATLDIGELVGGFRDPRKTQPFGLQGDTELARTTADAFLRAFIHAVPTGKQNSFAAHNPPSLVFAVVRDGPAVSLANAFVRPVQPRQGESLVEESIKALDGYYGRLTAMYGERGRQASAVCQMDGVDLTHLKDPAATVDEVVTRVVEAAFAAGEAR